MIKKTSLIILGLFLYGTMAAQAEFRVWTGRDGGSSVEAQFIDVSGKKVILEKMDGKRIMVPKAGLCEADQEYLASVIEPELKIKVDKDSDSRKLSEGYSYTYKEETYDLTVKIDKLNKDKCTRKFKAHLYVIAKSATGGSKKVMAHKEHSFSFESGNTTTFSSTSSVRNEDWYGGKEGWDYEGYIVYVENDKGKVISIESTKSSYDSSISLLKKHTDGKAFRM